MSLSSTQKDGLGVLFTHISRYMILDIIFIRHAQSCANIWKKVSKIKQITYKDPELTEAGIKTSIKLSPILLSKITKLWKNNPYTVGASQMIRTQETAYYMIGNNKPINIIPHVGEAGVSYDNYSFPKDKQREYIKQRNPKILESLDKGIDSREKQTNSGKSNWPMFLKWAVNNLNSFGKGSDGIYRAVIFTHSHFLKNSFKLSNKEKIINNNGIRVIISNDNIKHEHIKINIGGTLILNTPDKCRISPYTKDTRKSNKSIKTIKTNTKTRKRPCKSACNEFMNNDDLLTNYNQHTYKEHLLNLISYSQKST